MGVSNSQKEIHVMAKYINHQTLDVNTEYSVIGLDLAKHDLSLAAISTDGEVFIVDQMTYADFLELAHGLSPALFSMEPCCGFSYLSAELQSLGHEVRVISGQAVSNWVKTYRSGQKTDANDAYALARLAENPDITSIRSKTLNEKRIMTIQGVRRQLVGQRTKTIVSFKGLIQEWGIQVKVGRRNLNQMQQFVDDRAEVFTEPVVKALTHMIEQIRSLDARIKELDSDLESMVMSDHQGRQLKQVLGIGTQIAARFISVVGDISNFKSARSLVAYLGCIPRNNITGHRNKPKIKNGLAPDMSGKGQGKISRHGDKYLRSLLIQGAAVIYMQYSKRALDDCPLRRWLEKQLEVRKPYGKIMVSLAAKLIRIMWAVLTHREKFDISKVSVSRSVFAATGAQKADLEVTAAT
jgi:transposase